MPSTAQTHPCHRDGIDHSASAPPVEIPRDHVGEFVIPGTGKHVWWTGRVAIGLRYEPPRRCDATRESSRWLQSLLLRRTGARDARHA